MGSIGCPLCCRHDFTSVVALHDHLLYYVYRPLQCAICNMHVGGIQELTHHLEQHLSEDTSTALRLPKVTLGPVVGCGSNVGRPTGMNSIFQNFYYSHGSPSTSSQTLNRSSRVVSSQSTEEPIELTLRAFFCQTCGAKVVGKDNYFSHINEHISRPPNLSTDQLIPSSSSFQPESQSAGWKDDVPASPSAGSMTTTPINVLTDSETVTSDGTREATGSPDTQLSDCMEENHMADQLLKLREWQLGKHGRRFRKHHLSFSKSPAVSNQSPLNEETPVDSNPSTLIDPGSVEHTLQTMSCGTPTDEMPGSVRSWVSKAPSSVPPSSPFKTTTEMLRKGPVSYNPSSQIEESSNVADNSDSINENIHVADDVSSPHTPSMHQQNDFYSFSEPQHDVLDDSNINAQSSPMDANNQIAYGANNNHSSPVVPSSPAEANTSSVFSSNSWISPHQPIQIAELKPSTKYNIQQENVCPHDLLDNPLPVLDKTDYLLSGSQNMLSSDLQTHVSIIGNTGSNKNVSASTSESVVSPIAEYVKATKTLSCISEGDLTIVEDLPCSSSYDTQQNLLSNDNPTNLQYSDVMQNLPSTTNYDPKVNLPSTANYDPRLDLPCSSNSKQNLPCSSNSEPAQINSPVDIDVVSLSELPSPIAGTEDDNDNLDFENDGKSNDTCHEKGSIDSKPYLHKKFHHDQERKVPPSAGIAQNADVNRYIHNFQSLLVNKLNATFGVDVPLKNEKLSLEVSKRSRDSNKNDQSSLQLHQVEYICEVCEQEFVSRYAYRAHCKTHEVEGQKNFACQYCDKKFFKKRTKDLHMRKHTGEKTHRCGLCSQVFTKLYAFVRHKEEVHSEKKRFVCAECGKAFSSQRQLQNHMGVHQRGKAFKCNYCDHACKTSSGLRTHKLEIHSKVQKGNLKCEVCNVCFKKASGLKRHFLRKHSQQQLKCDLCNKVYSCNEDLLHHKKTHNCEPYQCNECEKSFASSWNLQRHSVVHKSTSHPYKCNKCLQTFTRLDSMLCHQKLHMQKKIHVCQCGKRFVKKSQLKAHEDKHSSVPRHKCNICGHAFKFQVSLKNHSCKVSGKTGEDDNSDATN